MIGTLAALAAPAAAASWIEQKLKNMDRSICQTIANSKCKAKPRKSQARKAKRSKPVKPVEQAVAPEPAQPSVEEAPADAAPAPVPEDKPQAEMPEADTVIAKSPPPAAEAGPEVPEIELVTAKKSAVPKPRPKPVQAAMADAAAEEPIAIPVPRRKPAGSARVVVAAVPSQLPEPDPPTAAGKDCPSQLAALNMSFDLVTQRVGAGACGVRNPVQLVSQRVGGEVVVFPDRPTVNCPFALRFASWMRERGQPLAERTAGVKVAKFYTGPGYQCRGRNGSRSGKLSEHAFGNAIDIERFELGDGNMVQVGVGNQRTVQALRKSACEYFTTVLGPGANAAHARHLHFDLAKRGRTGTYRICD